MNIFIDESGSFANSHSQASKNHNLNCVVAVIMTDDALKQWNIEYSHLGKASSIEDIPQIHAIINFLVENNAKAFIVCTDISQYHNATLEHQNVLNANTQATINGCKNLFENNYSLPINDLSIPDYIKNCCSQKLCENVARGIFKSPWNEADIKILNWYYDDPITNLKLKQTIEKSLLFYPSEADQPIEIINAYIKYYQSPCSKYLNYKKIFNNFGFASEENQTGIKAADCVANFMRRALTQDTLFPETKNLEILFSLPYSVDALHFDNNQEFLDSGELTTTAGSFFSKKLEERHTQKN